MVQGVFGRVSAWIEAVRTVGLEGPLGLTPAQVEVRRQDEIAWVLEQAAAKTESSSQTDVLKSLQTLLSEWGKDSAIHFFGEITEDDVLDYWANLPEHEAADMGLIERPNWQVEGDRLWRQQCEEQGRTTTQADVLENSFR